MLKKHLKSILAIVLSTTLLVPVQAYAMDNPSGTTIPFNQEDIDNNSGTIEVNSGTVEYNTNTGDINVNGGVVNDNAGHIGTNVGTVNGNRGEITINNATVVFDGSTGSIDWNQANDSYTNSITVGSNVTGTITDMISYDNLTVDPNGVLNITNDYSGIAINSDDNINIHYSYHSVNITGLDNQATAIYGGAFDNSTVTGKHYVQTHANELEADGTGGTITITPSENYSLSNTQNGGETNDIGWQLIQNDDGSYTVNLSYLRDNLELTLNDLYLVLSAITNGGTGNSGNTTSGTGDNISENAINVDNIILNNITVTDGQGENNDDSSWSIPDISSNIIDMKTLRTMVDGNISIVSSIHESTGIELIHTINLYFNEKIDLNSNIIKYLCEGENIRDYNKNCHFFYQGDEYVLYIPAFSVVPNAYKIALFLLNTNEPSGIAGFMRIAVLFKDCGFTCTKIGPIPTDRPSDAIDFTTGARTNTDTAMSEDEIYRSPI